MEDSSREREATVRTVDVRRLSGSLGAEVRGIDLGSTTADDIDTILELFTEHLVLLFPEQHLSIEQHLAFGRRFGTLEGHPHLTQTSEVQEIFELRSSGGGVADEWHSDLTCGRAVCDVDRPDGHVPRSGRRHDVVEHVHRLRAAHAADA